jgi:steroid delta-isomerase-like uncharacterized protein
MASRTTDAAQVATQLIEAFNTGDWEATGAMLAPDVVYVETGTWRRVEGAEAYLALLREWRTALPDVHGVIEAEVAAGDLAAQELRWTATHTGPLPTPAGTLPPTGRAIEVVASLWCRAEDGRAREVHHHLDVLALLQQIGALDAG